MTNKSHTRATQSLFYVEIKSGEAILFSSHVKSRSSKLAISNTLRNVLRSERMVTNVTCEAITNAKEEIATKDEANIMIAEGV